MIAKNLTILKALLIGSIVAICLGSCNLDEFPNLDNVYLPNYEGNIALLLVNDTVSFREFIENNLTDTTNYEITEEQQILFSYELNSDFNLGSEFVEIDGFSRNKRIESPIKASYTSSIDTTVRIVRQFAFDFPATDGELLDSIYFDGGEFKLEFLSTFPVTVDYTLTATSFTSLADQTPIEIISTIDPSVRSEIQRRTLDGYKVNLFSESDSSKFLMTLVADIILSPGDQLQGDEYLFLDVAMENPDHDFIFGSFGQDTFTVEEKRKRIKFFDDLGGTGIRFEDPKIEFTIDNGFGLPVGVDFSGLYFAYAEREDGYFTGSIVENVQQVGAPSVENFGTTERSTITIDVANSNLRQLLADSPNEIVISPTGYSNLGNTSSNWLGDESEIAIAAKVSIPFSVNLSAFEYEQITDLDDLSDLEGTKELILLINTVNEMPFNGEIEIYMLDENDNEINSITDQVLFAVPTSYDSNGKVSAPAESRTEITLNQSLINDLISASKLKTVIKIESYNASDGDFVEIFADYDLQIKLGIAGTVSVDINGN